MSTDPDVSDPPADGETGEHVVVTDHADRRRFVATIGGEPAGYMTYDRRGEHLFVRHTETDPAFEGRGVGSSLSRHVLALVRAEGLRLVPLCPFLSAYMRRHPGDEDLVDQQMLAAYRR